MTLERLKRQRRFDKLSAKFSENYPDTYGGGWMGKGPDGRPSIRFTGTVPEKAREVAKTHDLAVDFRPDAKHSLSEIRSLKDHVHHDLLQHGHPHAVTAYKVSDQKIYSTAVRPPDSNKSDEQLRERPSPASRSSDVNIQFTERHRGELDHSYGGLPIWWDEDGDGEWDGWGDEPPCTTGFTVENRNTGTTGVATAGHCGPGMNRIKQMNGVTYSTNGIAQHVGQWGDFEWHTTPHVEPNEFWINYTTRREVQGIEPASWIDEGDIYRRWGWRTGEAQDTVYAESVSSGGVDRLVAMEHDYAGGGDSGGPWYSGNSAAGLHRGEETIWFEERDVWSKAYYIDEALGVYIRN